MAIDISNRPDRAVKTILLGGEKSSKPGLSADILKLIALAAMTLDHIAWLYMQFGSFMGQFLHIVGRIAAPLMCFFIAEGYSKTRNLNHYLIRLGLFAVISHVPYVYFETGKIGFFHTTSAMLPLFLGALCLYIRDSEKLDLNKKNIIMVVLCLVSVIGDWGGMAVVWIMIFGSRISSELKIRYFAIASGVYVLICLMFASGPWYASLFQIGVFLAIPLIMIYNGERHSGNDARWFYYIYYPAHMVFLKAMYPVIFKWTVYIIYKINGS